MMTIRSRLAASKSAHLRRSHGSSDGIDASSSLDSSPIGRSQAFEVDAPEEVAVLVVGVLVGGDNIAAESEQMTGDAGDDAGAVDA